MAAVDIEISEVGPRDGLQSIAPVMPTAAKKAWIGALAAAGIPEIEVGSFVPASVLPQLEQLKKEGEAGRRKAGGDRRGVADAPAVGRDRGWDGGVLAAANPVLTANHRRASEGARVRSRRARPRRDRRCAAA